MLVPRYAPAIPRATSLLACAILLVVAVSASAEILGPDDFEIDLGSWQNVGGDDFDWERDSDDTSSIGTGPSADHTTGTGFYVYTEASSPRVQGEVAWLESSCLDLTGVAEADWAFFYHMNGAEMGTLRAQVRSSTGSTCAALGAPTNGFTLSGDQPDVWTEAVVALPVGGSVVLRFEGERGADFSSDMALDDVVVRAPCTSNTECNDGIACTTDVCSAGTCVNTDSCPLGNFCDLDLRICRILPSQLLVDSLDLDQYKLHIENLSSLDPPIDGTRYWSTAGNAAARDYIEAQLESWGYTVERHGYTYQSTAMDQVYATKIGKDPSRMYIVGGHMDSTNLDSGNPTTYAPGANDDASGTSVVLELARVFALAHVETDVSIRFILWNNEETGLNGSGAYASGRASLQGIENPPGSGLYPEPTWLGVIQHDMMMWDHGLANPSNPPWPPQDPNADVDVEYQANSTASAGSQALAAHFVASNATYATDYPAQVGNDMCCTDSVPFEDIVPSISLRENRRRSEIGNGSDPHWHQDTDFYETFGPEDFLLGFNAAQTSTGALAELVNATAGRLPSTLPASSPWGLGLLGLLVASSGAALLASKRGWLDRRL
jgi:hypothetical protein